MEQFSLRERLDNIENQHNVELLDGFHTEIVERRKNVYDQLLQYIKEQDWHTALNHIYKIRYLNRLLEQVEKIQEMQFPL